MERAAPLDVQLYRVALYLHPSGFREEFSPQMLRDFIEARAEAWTPGSGGPWAFRTTMAADLIRSIIHQWLRTGWPVILILAVTGPLTAVSLLARMWRPISFDFPLDTPNTDVITVELLAAVAVVVIAATIIFTVGFARRVPPRRRF